MDPEDFQDEPIDADERELLQQDLVDVEALKTLLGSKGIRGVVFYCPDCDEDHYLGWDLLSSNLKELLDMGESPVHEPAFDPDPDEYVSWDYARGYLDGYETFRDEDFGERLTRLRTELARMGWRPEDIASLLGAAGFGGESSRKA